MSNLTRRDPLDDFFRGFLVRPVEYGGGTSEAITGRVNLIRKQSKDVKEGERVLRTERYFGQVSRSFQLGQDVDESRSSAKFADGVLELTLPKKLAPQAKRLVID